MVSPLWDRWKGKLKEYKAARPGSFEPHSPEDFRKLIASDQQLEEMRKQYNRVHHDRRILLDLRAQEDWADAWEKLRFLIFRTALALIIAGVVLLTAYLAKRWELQVPMLRQLSSISVTPVGFDLLITNPNERRHRHLPVVVHAEDRHSQRQHQVVVRPIPYPAFQSPDAKPS